MVPELQNVSRIKPTQSLAYSTAVSPTLNIGGLPVDIYLGTNIATDVLLATLPIPKVWKLQVNVRTKISLIAILSLGFL